MSTVVQEPLGILPPLENGLLHRDLILPPTDLLEEDGIPLETAWHRWCMNLLIEVIEWLNRDRKDFYVGGNQFIYFNARQARNLDYRGPDFFFVDGVPHEPIRKYWAIWLEDGRYPDVIIELSSSSTKDVDETTKKDIYERTFKTQNYFIYDPETQTLQGWHLIAGKYQPLSPNEHGWLWSDGLGAWVGTWQGAFMGRNELWLRFYDQSGNLIPTFAEAEAAAKQVEHLRADMEHQRAETANKRAEELVAARETAQERAEAERQRAEAERQRAEALAAEIEKLKALLAAQQATQPEGHS